MSQSALSASFEEGYLCYVSTAILNILIFLAFKAVETFRKEDFFSKRIEIMCRRKSYKPQA